MCGIAGVLELQGETPNAEILRTMARRLRHRGPDGEGMYVDGPCGLVHRRLAILDPQGGKQPLSNEDQTVWIAYNGEIYNSPELRRFLQGKGHTFRTTTDTEVIVHLYEEQPDQFVERLEGIFAFGIWDSRRQRLTVACDYLSVKPLYYFSNHSCFLFASEIKALLADPRIPCEPDEKSLMEILAFQNTYPGRSCFKGISLLEGGEAQVIQPGRSPASKKFWTFSAPNEYSRCTLPEAAVQLRQLIQTVVRDQLLSDVPVASYLSGGMDTGTLTAIASRSMPSMLTFSGGFMLDGVPLDQRAVDERDAAQLMSREFNTRHWFREIRPDDMATSLSAISWHLEEPRGSTCYAPWIMAQEAGARVKVILSGHGGDELFAGYRAHYQLAQQAGGNWENVWFEQLNHLIPMAQAAKWLHPDFVSTELLTWPRQAFETFVEASRGLTALARTQHHDLFVYMHGLLLIEDKLSMAHGLESRVPFLDRRIFDFAWSIPDDWKLSPYRGKEIVRHALEGVLPPAILARDKMGFGPPDNHYYRTTLRPFLECLLLDGSFEKRKLIRVGMVEKIFRRHLNGESLAQTLWTFASIEMWYRTFMDRIPELRALPVDGRPGHLDLRSPVVLRLAAEGSQAKGLHRRLRQVACGLSTFTKQNTLGLLAEAKWNLHRVRRLIWPTNFSHCLSAWWALTNGSYAVDMRSKLEKYLMSIPRPKSAHTIGIFQGLYSAPQPVFLKQGFEAKGMVNSYETLDRNPGFPPPDAYHQMQHPDIYREHAKVNHDRLLPPPPSVSDQRNLGQLEEFLLQRWRLYDVFHFNWFLSFLPDNVDVEFLRRSGRSVYFHFRGCFILTKIIDQFTERGGSVVDACRYCKNMGWRDAYFSRFHRAVRHASRIFVSTPNLCHCSEEFEYIPNSLEPAMESIPMRVRKQLDQSEPVIILHAPFNDEVRGYKGTRHVIDAVGTLQREGLHVELRLIQNMSRTEAVQQYGQGDIFVEQLHLGSYGNTAIEAMAYGLPVISSHHPAHAHLVPDCPVVHADPLTLTDRLRELVRDPELRWELGQKSYHFVRRFHSNKKIVDHLLKIYREDLGTSQSGPRNTIRAGPPTYR